MEPHRVAKVMSAGVPFDAIIGYSSPPALNRSPRRRINLGRPSERSVGPRSPRPWIGAPGFNTAGLSRSTSVVISNSRSYRIGRVARAISVVTWVIAPIRTGIKTRHTETYGRESPGPEILCHRNRRRASAVPAPINEARAIGRPARLPTQKK
jgi:hypothetical protein